MSAALTADELAAERKASAERQANAAREASAERGLLARLAATGLPLTSLLALADQAIVSGTSFAMIWLVKRMSDDAGLGRYSLGLSILALAAVAHSSLILSPYTFFVHQVQEERRRGLAGSVLALHLLVTLALIALCVPLVALAQALVNPGTAALAWALLIAAVGVLLREFARKVLLAEWQVITLLVVDGSVAALQLAAVAALARGDWLGAATGHLAAGVAAGAVGAAWLFLARRQFRLVAAEVRSDWQRGFHFGKWVCADQGLMVASAYLAHWVLVALLGVEATGRFAVCLIVIQLANPILFGMGNILEPAAARAVARGGVAGLRRYAASTTAMLGAVFGVLAITFALLGPAFIRLAFRADFEDLTLTVAILALQIFIFALAVGYHLGLRAVQRSELNVVIGLAGFLVTLFAALIGVRTLGVVGAALAMLAGNLTIWLGRWLAFHQVTRARLAEVQP
jgi:O-antigen/teichoic acid export membrane protein